MVFFLFFNDLETANRGFLSTLLPCPWWDTLSGRSWPQADKVSCFLPCGALK